MKSKLATISMLHTCCKQILNHYFYPLPKKCSSIFIIMYPVVKRLAIYFLITIAGISLARGQLCTGSLGDPVINITFGSGGNPGPPLLAATTTYQYAYTECPNDGSYTVVNSTSGCFGKTWQTVRDHTGNTNGYFMLINASFQPSDFYLDTVKGLCPSTTFEFASWILNMLVPSACSDTGIVPNITFSIETTTGAVLQSYNTGNIPSTSSATWNQYGFYFKTPAGITDVVLRMRNNAPGGCGNDLALDDITFRPCGPLVTASVSGNNGATKISLCESDPTVLLFNSVVSAGYISPAFQWQLSTDSGATWNDIAGATASSYTRQPTTPGYYKYRLTVAESGNIGITTCRVASNPVTVYVDLKPVPSATSNSNTTAVCAGQNIILSATVVASANDTIQYQWSGPQNFSAQGQSVNVPNAQAANAGTYSVVATTNVGCSNTTSTIVNIFPDPVAQFATSPATCENSVVNFSDQSTVPGQTLIKWQWNFGDGDSSSLQNPSHLFTTAGTYAVSLFTQTDKGCVSDTLIKQIIIHVLPQPDFGTPKVCLTDPFAAFTDSSTIADGSQAQFSWLWNFGDNNASPANPNTSTQENPQHHYSSVGIYNVQLTVTSKDGCVNDTTKSFTVNGAVPLASFSVNGNGYLCSNQQVTITDNSTVNFGSIVKVEIYWDYLNDPLNKTVDSFPAQGKQYNYTYPDFGNPLTKTYQIRYVAYSGISCVNETQQTITINASPQIQFDAVNPVCESVSPFSVTQARETAGLSGSGVYSGNGINAGGLFSPSVASAGLDTIHYTFTATGGCTASATQTILVYPQPTADAGPDRTVLEGSYITLEGSGTGNNITYLWLPDSAIDNNMIATPKVSPVNDIEYTLIVTSFDGCVDSSHVLVTVLKKPIIPNAFSPNGDGINDTWVLKYLDSYPGAEISVFNRYGQLVYHSINYPTPWDGTYNGKPLPVATYYWIVNPKNGRAQTSGSVTIIR
jgi:gliding motility-associated-like protein